MPYVSKLFSLFLLGICLALAPAQAHASPRHSTQAEKSFSAVGQKASGLSAWYGQRAHGKPTASGKIFDSTQLTAAHRTLPFGTLVKVTNKRNKKSTVVKITDRGPSAKKYIIDISRQAANAIDMRKQGVAPVTLEIVALPAASKKKGR